MKSLTIHGLDETLDARIRERAREEGASLNKTLKKLLEEALGVRSGSPPDHRQDFMDLFGCWTEADAAEFARVSEDLRKIDPEDWK